MSASMWPVVAVALLAGGAMAKAEANFDPARLSAHVRALSADEFEGRAPGSAGEKKTIAYLVRELQWAGVEPGGERVVGGNRGWTQAVPLRRYEIVGDPAVTLRLGRQAEPLRQGETVAVRAPMTGQARVRLVDVPLLFVGYGVHAPERGWDDFKGSDVRGKMLVVLVNDPDHEGGDGDFGGRAMTYYGRWTYKYEEAARRGAAGVMIVHETGPAAYGWATVRNSNSTAMIDIVRDRPQQVHPPLESWIPREVAVRLFEHSGIGFAQAKQAARRRDFRPLPLKARLSADIRVRQDRITTHNVVGRLTGRSRPAETLVYTAHHDHLGIGPADGRGDRLYNGAVDNATGLAQLIEQARAFAAAPRLDRSIVFLALAAEEKGLLGSQHYAAHPLYPLATTAAVINTDSLGVHGRSRDFSIAGTARLGLVEALVAEGTRRGRTFTPDPHPETGGFFRSDHFPFAKAGVPAISFKPGTDLVAGGTARGEALMAAYTRDRYHQPADEWSPDWDFAGLAADAELLHGLGRRLASSREWPNWSSDSEFRAIRNSTAAERR